MANVVDKMKAILHQKKCERKYLIHTSGDQEIINKLSDEIKDLEKRIGIADKPYYFKAR